MKFRTAFEPLEERVRSSIGSRIVPQYKMSIDENGKRELKKVGEIDLYAEIQSYAQSVDINYILERFCKGDETALSKIQGTYGDFTQMPKTYAELAQRAIDAQHYFDALPLDVRGQFNFSASEFFASIGTEKYNAIFNSPVELEVPDIQTPAMLEKHEGEVEVSE